MIIYYDSINDLIIETSKYSLCEETFGLSIKKLFDKWDSTSLVMDKEDFEKYYGEYNTFKDLYSPNDLFLDHIIDRIYNLRAFI